MNIKSAYIPKSKKGQAVARCLRKHGWHLKNNEVLGKRVCNLPIRLSPQIAAEIAYILDPEYAATRERWAFEEAYEARKEGFNEYADQLEEGWWALGY